MHVVNKFIMNQTISTISQEKEIKKLKKFDLFFLKKKEYEIIWIL